MRALRFYTAALTLLVALAAPGCSRPAADDAAAGASVPNAVLAVSAARVTIKPMRQELTLIGTTAALRTLTLRAPAAGRVVGLQVQTGDHVRRGEVIAHIISREDEAARAGVEAAQKIDPSEAASLESSVKRYSSGPGIPVTVPQDLVVSQRVVSPGQIVNEFDPMVELVDPASVYVDAQVPIDQLGLVKPGMDATITSPLKPGIVYPGRVWSLSPSFSVGGTIVPAWVQFVGDKRITEIGASVEVHVTAAVGHGACHRRSTGMSTGVCANGGVPNLDAEPRAARLRVRGRDAGVRATGVIDMGGACRYGHNRSHPPSCHRATRVSRPERGSTHRHPANNHRLPLVFVVGRRHRDRNGQCSPAARNRPDTGHHV